MKKLPILLLALTMLFSLSASENIVSEHDFFGQLAVAVQEVAFFPGVACKAIATVGLAPLAQLFKELEEMTLPDSISQRSYHVAERVIANNIPLTASLVPYFYYGEKAARSQLAQELIGSASDWLLKISLALYFVYNLDLLTGYLREPLSSEKQLAPKKYSLLRLAPGQFVKIPVAER